MKISYIKEAPLLRAYLLINQEKNKKNVFKSIQTEISKMSELFCPDFDRSLHLILFNDIDFKDPKTFQKTKDRKIEYFLQDFPQFIERPDFIEIFSRILMDTKNTGTTTEIFNGLNKQCKLSIENQMKLIISFEGHKFPGKVILPSFIEFIISLIVFPSNGSLFVNNLNVITPKDHISIEGSFKSV